MGLGPECGSFLGHTIESLGSGRPVLSQLEGRSQTDPVVKGAGDLSPGSLQWRPSVLFKLSEVVLKKSVLVPGLCSLVTGVAAWLGRVNY